MAYREAYEEYLKSQHWFDLREVAFNRANRKCETCAAKPRHGHHIVYRNPLTECTADDIMALCERCHNLWHKWLDQMGWKPSAKFCRELTKGAILVLLNPPKVEQQKMRRESTPPKPPVVDRHAAEKPKKLSKKQRKRLRIRQAEELAEKWTSAPASKSQPKSKAEKRAAKVARMDERNKALKHDGVEAAITSMNRAEFREYIFKTFAGNPDWNSITSYAFAAYDRRRPEELAKVREANRQRARDRAAQKAVPAEPFIDPSNCPF